MKQKNQATILKNMENSTKKKWTTNKSQRCIFVKDEDWAQIVNLAKQLNKSISQVIIDASKNYEKNTKLLERS